MSYSLLEGRGGDQVGKWSEEIQTTVKVKMKSSAGGTNGTPNNPYVPDANVRRLYKSVFGIFNRLILCHYVFLIQNLCGMCT